MASKVEKIFHLIFSGIKMSRVWVFQTMSGCFLFLMSSPPRLSNEILVSFPWFVPLMNLLEDRTFFSVFQRFLSKILVFCARKHQNTPNDSKERSTVHLSFLNSPMFTVSSPDYPNLLFVFPQLWPSNQT